MLQVTMDQRGNVRLGITGFNSSNVDQQLQINVYARTFSVIVSHGQTLSMMTKIATISWMNCRTGRSHLTSSAR